MSEAFICCIRVLIITMKGKTQLLEIDFDEDEDEEQETDTNVQIHVGVRTGKKLEKTTFDSKKIQRNIFHEEDEDDYLTATIIPSATYKAKTNAKRVEQ
jgi:hypothetical protein